MKLDKKEILDYHIGGKMETVPSVELNTARDLSIAYSPGVAEVCLEIQENPDSSFEYTTRKNLVAVISNGTAVLGLGDIGALAGKPVMEGKSALFKTFANVDSIDINIDEKDPDKFIEIVKKIAISFGGINLEDIKSPECFKIEQELVKALDIPIMHDDQHGTAIISLAGIINALELVNKKMQEVKMVVIGAGAAAVSCAKLCKDSGIENIYMIDINGVLTTKRTDLSKEQKIFARDTDMGSLRELIDGADIVLGLSAGNQIDKDMVKSMAKDPIIFAMANPVPEIMPDVVHSVRDDAIVGTGRSDFVNQVNNVLGFPYIFRGALDVRATKITEGMKIAAANALAKLAKEPVPQYVKDIYNKDLSFSKDYIIPTPFDKRLLEFVAPAIAEAAIADGVNKKEIDIEEYKQRCKNLSNKL
jgi:malate dehydrogenase (oxaloacetate-decarboxylating)(NADP+)